MKRIILIIIVFLLIAAIIAAIFIGKKVLPGKVKAELITKTEQFLNRKVELGEIKFDLLKGVVIKNLVILDDAKINPNPLLSIDTASVKFSLLSIIAQRKFIINSININNASLRIIRLPANQWNFSDIFNVKPKAQSKSPALIINKVGISNTKIFFEDRTLSPVFTQTIEDINIRSGVSLLAQIKFNLEAKIKNGAQSTLIYSGGDYSLTNKKFSGFAKIKNAPLERYYFYVKRNDLSLEKCLLGESDFNIFFENNKLQVLAKANVSGLGVKQKNLEFAGDLNIGAELNYNPANKGALSFFGDIELPNSTLKGVPYAGTIENISGVIAFDTKKVWSDYLSAKALNCPLKLSGSMENFSNPDLNLNLNSDINLSNIIAIIPENIKASIAQLEGNIRIELALQTAVKNIKAANFTGKAEIATASLKLNNLSDTISDIQGDLTFDRNGAGWTNLSCLYKDMPISTNGSMVGFINPTIEAQIKSGIFDINTKLTIDKNTIGISQFTGGLANSKINVTGMLNIADKQNPKLDITSDSTIEIEDLKNISQALKDNIEKLKLSGSCMIKANLKGSVKNKQNLQGQISANSQKISFYGYQLNDIRVDCQLAKDMKYGINLTTLAYDGTLSALGNLDLSDNPKYTIDANLSNLDLNKLIADTPIKEKDISGFLSAKLNLSGVPKDSSSINGQGSLKVLEGDLWQLNLLKGFGKFLTIPEFDKIVFKEVYGDFIIAKQAVLTDNLTFLSDELALNADGRIGFDKKLDLMANAQFSEEMLKQSAGLRKYIAGILGQASAIISVKVGGTISEPKYTPVIKPLKDGFDYFKQILKDFGVDVNIGK